MRAMCAKHGPRRLICRQGYICDKSRSFDTVLGRAPSCTMTLDGRESHVQARTGRSPGGTLIIYGPHIREVSRAWGQFIERVGYHTRIISSSAWTGSGISRRGVLAHLTTRERTGACHCGIEEPDVKVVLATFDSPGMYASE